jgi:hypothetical protein
MSLSRSQGPAPGENYMGFSTKRPPQVRRPGEAGPKAKGAAALMAAGVVLSALVGVGLGLRDTEVATYAGPLRADAALTVPAPPEPGPSEAEAVPWRPASIETVSVTQTPAPSVASPAPAMEAPGDLRRRDRAGQHKAEAKGERQAGPPRRSRPVRMASNSRERIRPSGWPYVPSVADPPY